MSEDPTTRELRVEQLKRAAEEAERADDDPTEEGTAQHERRAERADYLRQKLEERAEAEREGDEP